MVVKNFIKLASFSALLLYASVWAQDCLVNGGSYQNCRPADIDGNIVGCSSKEYSAPAPCRITPGAVGHCQWNSSRSAWQRRGSDGRYYDCAAIYVEPGPAKCMITIAASGCPFLRSGAVSKEYLSGDAVWWVKKYSYNGLPNAQVYWDEANSRFAPVTDPSAIEEEKINEISKHLIMYYGPNNLATGTTGGYGCNGTANSWRRFCTKADLPCGSSTYLDDAMMHYTRSLSTATANRSGAAPAPNRGLLRGIDRNQDTAPTSAEENDKLGMKNSRVYCEKRYTFDKYHTGTAPITEAFENNLNSAGAPAPYNIRGATSDYVSLITKLRAGTAVSFEDTTCDSRPNSEKKDCCQARVSYWRDFCTHYPVVVKKRRPAAGLTITSSVPKVIPFADQSSLGWRSGAQGFRYSGTPNATTGYGAGNLVDAEADPSPEQTIDSYVDALEASFANDIPKPVAPSSTAIQSIWTGQ